MEDRTDCCVILSLLTGESAEKPNQDSARSRRDHDRDETLKPRPRPNRDSARPKGPYRDTAGCDHRRAETGRGGGRRRGVYIIHICTHMYKYVG